jgi:hypothetical protein
MRVNGSFARGKVAGCEADNSYPLKSSLRMLTTFILVQLGAWAQSLISTRKKRIFSSSVKCGTNSYEIHIIQILQKTRFYRIVRLLLYLPLSGIYIYIFFLSCNQNIMKEIKIAYFTRI